MGSRAQEQAYKFVYTWVAVSDGSIVDSSRSEASYKWNDFVSFGKNYSDWKFRLRSSVDCTTSASGFKSRVSTNKAGLLSINLWVKPAQVSYSETYAGAIGTNQDPEVAWPYNQALYDSTLSAFVSKARAAQYQFQGGVFLGEIKETINLLRSPLKGFRKLTKEYHSKAKKLARTKLTKRQRTKQLSEEWLRYSFGIKPLIQDIDDAMHDLAYIIEGRPETAPILVQRRDAKLLYSYKGAGTSRSWWTMVLTQYSRSDESVTIRGAVSVALPKIGKSYYGNDLLMHALSDFIPTLWELIPYSFLVDYFTNVGDFISALTFLESSVKWCNCTKRLTVTRYMHQAYTLDSASAFPPGSAYRYDGSDTKNPESEVVTSQWDRAIISSFIPSLHFDFGSLTKWRRMTNMTALLAASRHV